jgi:monofunctional biosynthetic peptidoglycan transglycosylase
MTDSPHSPNSNHICGLVNDAVITNTNSPMVLGFGCKNARALRRLQVAIRDSTSSRRVALGRHRSLLAKMPKPKPKKWKSKRPWKWILLLLVVLLLIPAMQVAVVRFINPPLTLPMLIEQGSAMFSSGPTSPLRYRWIALPQIPEMFLEHLWISEDQRFFQHEGFDWKEMELAVKEAERKGKPVRGASTITNQCARSIFLWQGRSWIRKGLESYYTIWMEALLPKRRIMELYANVIEMGRGIYGVEAASQHYFGVSARGLTREQSAMLAAVLPNPKGWDPAKPGRMLRWRQRRILQREQNANFPEQLLR